MKKKRILLINHYAGSPEIGMEFRPYYFAREWVKDGHRVDIIAADFSHLRIKNPTILHDYEEQIIEGIHYHWIHTRKYEGNGVKRAITMFQFVGKMLLHAKKIARKFKPDVIITSSTYPLDTYAGQKIKKYTGKQTILIHEIHDMWPITPIEIGGMSPKNPFIWLLQRAENSFCRNSDIVVSLAPCAKNYLVKHGMDEDKFVHISNGIVEEEWRDCISVNEKVQNELTKIRKKHKKIICFFGSHTISYALEYIIDAVKCFDPSNVGLLMVGNGNDKERLIKRAKESENIYFMDSIPKKNIPDLLRQIDIIYVGALNNQMFRFGICMNKLFDSMMAGKPILYAVKAPNNYIKDYNCGITVETENADALVKGIEQLIGMSGEELEAMGKNGTNAVMEHFTTHILARQFENLF